MTKSNRCNQTVRAKPDVESPSAPESASFQKINARRALSEAIVGSIREPLLVLDRNLRVVTASPSFCSVFDVDRREVQDQPFCTLCDGQWNIPELTLLLANVLAHHTAMEAYEVEVDLRGLGQRTMRLNACEILREWNDRQLLLVTMEDITEWRDTERATAALLRQKDILLREMRHRFANSLQIIASILLLKACHARSDETRLHLADAHRRIMSVATVQQQLDMPSNGGLIELGPYLSQLCETLADSIVGEDHRITVEVRARRGCVAPPREAFIIGLMVTELVMNAIKHAFVPDTVAGRVVVAYEANEASWRLTVSDNGAGMTDRGRDKAAPGLGTCIVEALARQLRGDVHTSVGPNDVGTSVTIMHVLRSRNANVMKDAGHAPDDGQALEFEALG